MKEKISIVLPCFNEVETIDWCAEQLIQFCEEQVQFEFEIIIVDDGSTDGSHEKLMALTLNNDLFRIITLSRNFGHQQAISAGLYAAIGDAVVMMDIDLQDPLNTVKEMIQHWRAGAQVVYGIRSARHGETVFKRTTANLFYHVLTKFSDTKIPRNVGDFRLLDREVVDIFNNLPESDRFVRGMISWIGYRQVGIFYERLERQYGETKYPLRKMLILSLDAIISFSVRPLRYVTLLGAVLFSLSLLGIAYAFFARILTHNWVEGWTLLFIAVLAFGGLNLFCLGILGEYIGRIYTQVKGRPNFIISDDTRHHDEK